jgi:hypothetical protein
MIESPFVNLATFEGFCGIDILSKILVATTMWKEVETERERRREEEIERLTGARTARFYNTFDSAWAVVGELVRSVDEGARGTIF